ncbi:MAG: Spi family protease inhibitor, partial [Tidjanibacter sp.]|nr:Spi family protease inhibitor [Tidjanibacter sp.]
MKLRLWRAVLIPIFGILVSCTNEVDSLVHEEDFSVEDVESTSPHHIPISKALSSLESIMESMDMENTRVMNRSNWTVTRIPMSTFKPQTRTGNTEVADALYVVDFEEGGYAILSADDRLPDEVIAVTNSGDLEFNPNPLEDPVLTLDDLYVEEDDDYLLGSEPRNDGTSAGFIEGLVANYVIGWIDSLRDNEDEFGDPMLPPGGGDSGGGDSGGGTGNLIVDYSYETEVVCDKMLQTQWHQRGQYNRYCPNKYRYRGLFGATCSQVEEYDFDPRAEWGSDYIDSVDLTAGCVAIAVGQILAYNQYPAMSNIV